MKDNFIITTFRSVKPIIINKTIKINRFQIVILYGKVVRDVTNSTDSASQPLKVWPNTRPISDTYKIIRCLIGNTYELQIEKWRNKSEKSGYFLSLPSIDLEFLSKSFNFIHLSYSFWFKETSPNFSII